MKAGFRLRSSVTEPTSAINSTGTAAMIENRPTMRMCRRAPAAPARQAAKEGEPLQHDQDRQSEDRDDVGDEQPEHDALRGRDRRGSRKRSGNSSSRPRARAPPRPDRSVCQKAARPRYGIGLRCSHARSNSRDPRPPARACRLRAARAPHGPAGTGRNRANPPLLQDCDNSTAWRARERCGDPPGHSTSSTMASVRGRPYSSRADTRSA